MKRITTFLTVAAIATGCARNTVYLRDIITGELHSLDARPGETVKLRGRVFAIDNPTRETLSTLERLRHERIDVPLGDTAEVDEWVTWLSGVDSARHPKDPVTVSVDLTNYQRPIYDPANTDPFAEPVGHTNRPPAYATPFSMTSAYHFLVKLAEHADLELNIEGRTVTMRQN
jgi:hypothetical protein